MPIPGRESRSGDSAQVLVKSKEGRPPSRETGAGAMEAGKAHLVQERIRKAEE